MLQYLGTLDPEKWQRTNLALRQPGTGIWFTDGDDFRTWLSTKNSKLWIYGIRKKIATRTFANLLMTGFSWRREDNSYFINYPRVIPVYQHQTR
jgi:hypothetical protein